MTDSEIVKLYEISKHEHNQDCNILQVKVDHIALLCSFSEDLNTRLCHMILKVQPPECDFYCEILVSSSLLRMCKVVEKCQRG